MEDDETRAYCCVAHEATRSSKIDGDKIEVRIASGVPMKECNNNGESTSENDDGSGHYEVLTTCAYSGGREYTIYEGLRTVRCGSCQTCMMIGGLFA